MPISNELIFESLSWPFWPTLVTNWLSQWLNEFARKRMSVTVCLSVEDNDINPLSGHFNHLQCWAYVVGCRCCWCYCCFCYPLLTLEKFKWFHFTKTQSTWLWGWMVGLWKPWQSAGDTFTLINPLSFPQNLSIPKRCVTLSSPTIILVHCNSGSR